MRILSAAAMREVDRRAIEEIGIPGPVLMENAAAGVADALAEHFPEVESVAVFCGPGNNGGDGLALARWLDGRGYRLRVFLVQGRRPPAGDAALQLEICRNLGLEIEEIRAETPLAPALAAAARADLVVDSLFGTGLSRPLEGHFAALVEALGEIPRPRLAVDLPSGLDAGSRELPGPCLDADLTVTFAAPKIAQVFAPAAARVGELVVVELGFPPSLVEEVPEEGGALHLLRAEELAAYLPGRSAESHKGTYGHLLLVAGAAGTAGAAVLAARGAVRGGAGLVTVAVPAPLRELVDGASLESMTVACAAEEGALAADATPDLTAATEGKAALAVGPGLGRRPATAAVVRELVTSSPLPLVLDADGLDAFTGRLGEIGPRRGETVLTPHPGELGRLLGVPTAAVTADRLGSARRGARESGAVVVLKGHQTLLATPDGEVFVNPTGNPGMATGGSGDVLTGMIGALLAQGYTAPVAAQLAVYLHGLAGDLALAEQSEASLAAADLVEHLGPAWRHLEEA